MLASRGPVVEADAAGVRIRGPWRQRHIPWTEIHAVEVEERRRRRALELDTDAGLVSVPAIVLGRIPLVVIAQTLNALWREATDQPH